MAFKIIRHDITKLKADVIVNTANIEPVYSYGTDTAVYKAAGEELLLAERKRIGYMQEGEVAITPGFNLPAKYIIHAASPFYEDGTKGEEEKLRMCYKRSLELAYEYKCKSIGFPLIGTGSFGYPKEEGMGIAVEEIREFLNTHEMLVYLVVFDTQSTKSGLYYYPDLKEYINENYVHRKLEEEYENKSVSQRVKGSISRCFKNVSTQSSSPKFTECTEEAFFDDEQWEDNESALKERMRHLSDTFQQYLLYLIEEKGLTNAEVYKSAIMTKQLFSKIKVNPDYHPDKATAMRLCIGAKLNLDETKDLLARAGYALSPCDKRDIIFSFFIERGIFDMIEIDIVLEEYGLPCFIS